MSIFVDVIFSLIKYQKLFGNLFYIVVTSIVFTLGTFIAGLLISSLFMGFGTLYALLMFALLHSGGGILGCIIGVLIVKALMIRGITSIGKWGK